MGENEVKILKLGKIWWFQKLRSARSTQSSNRQLSDLQPWLKLQREIHLQLRAEGISTMEYNGYLSKCSMDNWLICVIEIYWVQWFYGKVISWSRRHTPLQWDHVDQPQLWSAEDATGWKGHGIYSVCHAYLTPFSVCLSHSKTGWQEQTNRFHHFKKAHFINGLVEKWNESTWNISHPAGAGVVSGCGWCTASSDVWDPATESPGDGGDHDGREEKTISMGKITGKSWEHDDGMMINDHILGCQICSHTSIIVRNPDQIWPDGLLGSAW